MPTCPHLQVYIVLIIRQIDKQKCKLKLCQAFPRASAFQNRMSTPAGSSYTLLFSIFINLSKMSIQKMASWNYFEQKKKRKKRKKSGCQFTHTQKKIELVFVKHYAPNIYLPINMANFTQCLISTNQMDFAEKLNR